MKLDDDLKQEMSVEDFWEENHTAKLNYQFWLTGSKGPDVWESLQVTHLIKPGVNVLNIGVGLGYCTRELARRKCAVSVLDISPSALEKVKEVVVDGWLPGDLSEIPPARFDLVISNLVSQHMAHEDLRRQVAALIPALKPEGVFAMQFAGALDPSFTTPGDPEEKLLKGGGVLRSLSYMTALVEEAGGAIVWADRVGVFKDYGCIWYAIQIVRADSSRIGPRHVPLKRKIKRALKSALGKSPG